MAKIATTKGVMGFRSWLLDQIDRGDPVADLAKDIRDDREFRGRTVAALELRMGRCGACSQAFEALKEAELEWRAYRRSVSRDPTPA